ncbi:hypothetical protein FIBSPDRAFT_942659 [Athelia psychrophila]|uniref:Uncharacterized protein n=1 Tax=Athelia psychrophila TaxID=1759441 RepID=A0A166X9A1_9AGAM|nr:hypothetical protein FIBSPDRAFT_942659 [Fibularhizoctonia sp. CBS 109695]
MPAGHGNDFEDFAAELQESEMDGLDSDFWPSKPKPAKGSFTLPADVAEDMCPSDAASPTRRKGKGKARQRSSVADVATDDDLPMSNRGRLTKDDISAFHAFGDTTRNTAQALADSHQVNLATVMRHAGLGAGKSSCTASDFNTFKNIFASAQLADTGVKPKPQECVTAYWKWIEDFPEESVQTDWLIDHLEALQAHTVEHPKAVSLPQIQALVRKVVWQFLGLGEQYWNQWGLSIQGAVIYTGKEYAVAQFSSNVRHSEALWNGFGSDPAEFLSMAKSIIVMSDKRFKDAAQGSASDPTPCQWAAFWEIGKTPRDSYRYFVWTYLLEQLGLYTTDHFSNFPYAKFDSLTFSLSIVMTGWHALGISQVPNATYTDKTGGGLALAHWKELTTHIPTSFRDNPYAVEYPGRLPLQIIELSEFLKLRPVYNVALLGQPAVVDHKGAELVLASESKAHALAKAPAKKKLTKPQRSMSHHSPVSSAPSSPHSPPAPPRAQLRPPVSPSELPGRYATFPPDQSPSGHPSKCRRIDSDRPAAQPVLKHKAPDDHHLHVKAHSHFQSLQPAFAEAGPSNLALPCVHQPLFRHVSPAPGAFGHGTYPDASYPPMQHMPPRMYPQPGYGQYWGPPHYPPPWQQQNDLHQMPEEDEWDQKQ